MRTSVVDGVELTVQVEQGDLLSLHLNQLAVVRFKLPRLRAFEVRAVFDDDLRCRQIPNHRTVFLDLDLALRTHDSLHVSTHHYLAGNDVSCHVLCRAHCQLPLTELDRSFDCSINVQILVAGDFAFHMQARSEPGCRAVRCRSRWTHHILVHLGCSPPRRWSGL